VEYLFRDDDTYDVIIYYNIIFSLNKNGGGDDYYFKSFHGGLSPQRKEKRVGG